MFRYGVLGLFCDILTGIHSHALLCRHRNKERPVPLHISLYPKETNHSSYPSYDCTTKLSYDILHTWETREPGGLPSLMGGADPPDERKEGVANVCYIC